MGSPWPEAPVSRPRHTPTREGPGTSALVPTSPPGASPPPATLGPLPRLHRLLPLQGPVPCLHHAGRPRPRARWPRRTREAICHLLSELHTLGVSGSQSQPPPHAGPRPEESGSVMPASPVPGPDGEQRPLPPHPRPGGLLRPSLPLTPGHRQRRPACLPQRTESGCGSLSLARPARERPPPSTRGRRCCSEEARPLRPLLRTLAHALLAQSEHPAALWDPRVPGGRPSLPDPTPPASP